MINNSGIQLYTGIPVGSLTPQTYSLTVVNGSGSGTDTAGTVVTIKANAPPAGQIFTNWTGATVANPAASTTTATMPAANQRPARLSARCARRVAVSGIRHVRRWPRTSPLISASPAAVQASASPAADSHLSLMTNPAINGHTATETLASGQRHSPRRVSPPR